MLRFLLNDTLVESDELSPDLTVLSYLRDYQGLCGTKEGCGSGDCGACTAVVVSLVNDKLCYRSINTCIAFVGSLHGCQLLTVEHLASPGKLHPAQQAMVDCHGSQCGFCTPGIVMSIFALTKNHTRPAAASGQRDVIDQALGGNLCRCTGYRPIVDAARMALDACCSSSYRDTFSAEAAATIAQLKSLQSDDSTAHGAFYRPRSIAAVCELRAQYPDASILAGGTDLALLVTQRHRKLKQIISLQHVEELNYCTERDAHWCIGAAYPLADFQQHFEAQCVDIGALLKRFGSTQVRNRGTVGGNIANASPIGDLPPLLIALRAQLVLQSSVEQRVIAIEDYFIDYRKTVLRADEILVEIRIPQSSLPAAADGPIVKIYKISKRLDDDISAALAVFQLTMKGAEVSSLSAAFGGMAAVPKRAVALEQVLTGKPLDEAVLALADAALEADFKPISDARASEWYRLQVCKNLLRRLAVEVNDSRTATRVIDYVG